MSGLNSKLIAITLLCIGNKTNQCGTCDRKREAMVVDSDIRNIAWFIARPKGDEACEKYLSKDKCTMI